jgi:hypothetical protein
MVNSVFIDLDALVKIENKAWIVDKNSPNIPLLKLSKSDFNLIKSGIYRSQNNKIEFNGVTYWLPSELINKLKIKAKISKIDFGNLAISLQEFLNKSIIDSLDFEVNSFLISKLKNTEDDIYIICSKQTKKNYQNITDKIEKEFLKAGLKIKNYYFISETFYNQKEDNIEFKKMRLLLQHLLGYKTEGDKFIDEEITKYNKIHYYDSNINTLKISDKINELLSFVLSNTDKGLANVIKEDVKDFRPTLYLNRVNDNEVNKIDNKKIILSLSTLIKTFESFRRFY